jgi:hypothetical protein
VNKNKFVFYFVILLLVIPLVFAAEDIAKEGPSNVHLAFIFAIVLLELITIIGSILIANGFSGELKELYNRILLGALFFTISSILHFIREFNEISNIRVYEELFVLFAFISFASAVLVFKKEGSNK